MRLETSSGVRAGRRAAFLASECQPRGRCRASLVFGDAEGELALALSPLRHERCASKADFETRWYESTRNR